MCYRREESEMSRAIALSLTESDKTPNKNSRKNDTADPQELPSTSTTATVTVNAPPGLKKKQSGNPSEPQDCNSLTLAPDPPPGFKKKQINYEMDFPVMIKAPESLPSVPSLSYGNLVGNNVATENFPTLSDVSTDKTVAPPPGFEKKMPTSTSAIPQPEKKEPIIKRLKQLLENDEKFEEFKTRSGDYRRCQISAEEYENHCSKLFGDQQWNSVFDELVATLPDKQRQDDLIKAHQNRNTKTTKKSKTKKHNYRPVMAWGAGNNSRVGDRMDNELYPPLSGTALVQPPPAKWGHKVAAVK